MLRDGPDATAFRSGDPWIMHLLVVCASRHGATAGIAARIAFFLRGTAVPSDLGKGYLFDNVTLSSS